MELPESEETSGGNDLQLSCDSGMSQHEFPTQLPPHWVPARSSSSGSIFHVDTKTGAYQVQHPTDVEVMTLELSTRDTIHDATLLPEPTVTPANRST